MADVTETLRTLDVESIGRFSLEGIKGIARVADVVDGDTMILIIPIDCSRIYKFNARISHIDVCEIHGALHDKSVGIREVVAAKLMPGKTETEFADRHAIRLALASNPVLVDITCHKFDKYGRVLVDVKLPDGSDLATYLIKNGMALPYEGKKKQAQV